MSDQENLTEDTKKLLTNPQRIIFNYSNQNLGLVYGRSRIIYGDKETALCFPKKEQNLHEGDIFNYLCKSNFIPFVSAMVNKEKFDEIGGFANEIEHSTDYVLFLNMAKKYNVKAIKGIHSKYRIHKNNLTNFNQITAAKESLKTVSSFLPDEDAMEGLKYQYINLAIAYFKEKKYLSFLQLLTKEGLWIRFIKRILKKLLLLLR